MTVNMILLLVSIIANALFSNGLPQGYCSHGIDTYALPSCDEAGDQFGYVRNGPLYQNDEEYPLVRGDQRNLQYQRRGIPQSLNNYAAGFRPMQLADHDFPMMSTSLQHQAYDRPISGYVNRQPAAYDEYGTYFEPMKNYDEMYDLDCPYDCSKSSSKKSKKNKSYEKRHNANTKKTTIDEVNDEEHGDKDSWGISRREKQKYYDEEPNVDIVKGKRSTEEEGIKSFKAEKDELERIKKEVNQDDAKKMTEQKIEESDKIAHQIMRIPRKTE